MTNSFIIPKNYILETLMIVLLASPDVTIHPEDVADEASMARTDDLEEQNRDLNSLSAVHVIFLALVWIAVFMTVYSGLSWAVFFHHRRFL